MHPTDFLYISASQKSNVQKNPISWLPGKYQHQNNINHSSFVWVLQNA